MFKVIKAFILLLFVTSCATETDDSSKVCTTNCTALQLQFMTLNNAPVEGVKATLTYHYSYYLGKSYTRTITTATSDENGRIQKDFYLKDDELGPLSEGSFTLAVDDSDIDVNQYIRSNNVIGSTTVPINFHFDSVRRRDTVIDATWYFPKKAYIKVNLQNFIPEQPNDYFEIRTTYPFGREINDDSSLYFPYSIGFSGYGNFAANGLNSQVEVFVASGHTNMIHIARRKNGVNTVEEIPIEVPENQDIELTYTY